MEKKSRRNYGDSKNKLDGRLMNNKFILDNLKQLFEEPKCELNYNNDWQLLIATILSAQCTDKKVNNVTPILFERYPTLTNLKNADFNELEGIIRPLGLSKTKASNIISLSKILNEKYNDMVPSNKQELVELPGVGVKTANVMLIEYFKIPAFPVDTHVSRVSKRLNICDESDSVTVIERKLTNMFPEKEWALLHLRMVLFGRYICKAIKPECGSCPFKGKCNYTK